MMDVEEKAEGEEEESKILMSKKAENILIRLIGYDWDDVEELQSSMQRLLEGIDPKKLRVEIKHQKGYHSDNIYVLEIKTNKEKFIKTILENLKNRVENKEELEKYIKEGRLDKNILYLRFDKDYFLRLDKLVPTEGGDVLYVKISFPGYLKREELFKIIKEFLTGD